MKERKDEMEVRKKKEKEMTWMNSSDLKDRDYWWTQTAGFEFFIHHEIEHCGLFSDSSFIPMDRAVRRHITSGQKPSLCKASHYFFLHYSDHEKMF